MVRRTILCIVNWFSFQIQKGQKCLQSVFCSSNFSKCSLCLSHCISSLCLYKFRIVFLPLIVSWESVFRVWARNSAWQCISRSPRHRALREAAQPAPMNTFSPAMHRPMIYRRVYLWTALSFYSTDIFLDWRIFHTERSKLWRHTVQQEIMKLPLLTPRPMF